MLRLTPTTITLTPGELRGLEHRRRFKRLLLRMSTVQIHEDSPDNDILPADTTDDGLGLRDEDSAHRPLPMSSPNSERLNRAPSSRTPDDSDAGPSRLTSAIHEASIAAGVAAKTPHRRQRSHSNDGSQTARQLSGSGPVLPPPFSTRVRAMTVGAISFAKQIPANSEPLKSTDAELLQQQRSVSNPSRLASTTASFDQFGQRTTERQSSRRTISPEPESDLPVYDDSMPPMLQPQTPQHLPESRHCSRVEEPHVTSSRHRERGGQAESPSVLQPHASGTDGFDGLFEGIENTDDETLYERSHGRRAIS